MQVVCQLCIYKVTVDWACALCRSRISADATEIQNGCPDKGLKGVHKIIMLYFIPPERTYFIGHVCNFKTLCTFDVVQFIVEMFTNFDVVFLNTVISPN